MNNIYEVKIRVASTDVDAFNQLKPAAVLGWFQHFGTDHGAILHMDREYLVDNYHACWILARVWYRMDCPVGEGEELTIRTWCRGAGGLIVYRDYDICRGDEVIGEGIAAWVVADLESRAMLRPSAIENLAVYEPPACVKTRQLKLIRSPKEKAVIHERQVRYSDLDVNSHMNNIRYADVIMDTFRPEQLEGRYLTEFQLNYSQESRFGDVLQISSAPVEGGYYVDGCSDDGKRRFEAVVRFARC